MILRLKHANFDLFAKKSVVVGAWDSGTQFVSTLFSLINHICVGSCFVLLSSKKMPERCVVYGCDNTANSKQGISLYRIPYWDDSREIDVRRRKNWLDFIRGAREIDGSHLLVQLFVRTTLQRIVLNMARVQLKSTRHPN